MILNAPICCISAYGCYNANGITSMIALNSTVINAGIAVRCDGYRSCQDSNHIRAVNGGDIFMSGYLAGYIAVIIETTQHYDIFCSGYDSCHQSILKNANNTYCSGHRACYQTFIMNISNVWMYGYYAGFQLTIIGLTENLYYMGDYVCFNANISSNDDNLMIQASGYKALYESSVNTHMHTNGLFNGDVSCVGNECLARSTIQNMSTIRCKGLKCLYHSEVEKVWKIMCNGSECLDSATIEHSEIVMCIGKECLCNTIIHNVSTIVVNGNNG